MAVGLAAAACSPDCDFRPRQEENTLPAPPTPPKRHMRCQRLPLLVSAWCPILNFSRPSGLLFPPASLPGMCLTRGGSLLGWERG